MPTPSIILQGTELVLMSSGGSLSHGDYAELTSDTRTAADNPGYHLGIFEFDVHADGFSAAPSPHSEIKLFEQKINSDSVDAPDVDASYPYDYLDSFMVDAADATQKLSLMVPIHILGAKYWVQWVDSGGTVSMAAGWAVRLIPVAIGVS